MFVDASILVIATSSWINIYQVTHRVIEKNFSYLISISLLVLLVVYMVVLLVYLLCNFKNLGSDTDTVQTRVGAAIEGYSVLRAGKPVLSAIFWSLGRRLLLSLIVTFGDGNMLVQFYYVHFSSIFMLA